jgi:thiamine-monophosphate kinase
LSALDHALGDGEDFELILAIPPNQAAELIARQPLQVPLTQIGQFIGEAGLFGRGENGTLQPLKPRGYEHRLDS